MTNEGSRVFSGWGYNECQYYKINCTEHSIVLWLYGGKNHRTIDLNWNYTLTKFFLITSKLSHGLSNNLKLGPQDDWADLLLVLRVTLRARLVPHTCLGGGSLWTAILHWLLFYSPGKYHGISCPLTCVLLRWDTVPGAGTARSWEANGTKAGPPNHESDVPQGPAGFYVNPQLWLQNYRLSWCLPMPQRCRQPLPSPALIAHGHGRKPWVSFWVYLSSGIVLSFISIRM